MGLPFVFFVLSMRSFFPFPAEPAVFHALSLGARSASSRPIACRVSRPSGCESESR